MIYDDDSDDGTYEFLEETTRFQTTVGQLELVKIKLGSPVHAMNRYLENAQADWFAKIDNDIAVPPGWLEALLGVVERDPTIDLLGMEAGRTGHPESGGAGAEWVGEPGFEEASHIGGVGLMRREAFDEPISARGSRFGFTQYQWDRQLRRGWIIPDLMVPQMDRIPTEPWETWSAEYLNRRWQRAWPVMDARWTEPYWGWVNEALGYRVELPTGGEE